MIVYRIANAAYKDDLSGDGAALYGARWNNIGTRMLYTAGSISLAVLEAIVHLRDKKFPPDQYLLKIEIPGIKDAEELVQPKLKTGWKQDLDYTRWLGDEFIKSNQALLLKIASAVIDEECNYLLNPQHKDAKKIKIISATRLELDKRLEML